MSFGSFVCQNDIKLQQKQPLVVLYQQMCQKKQNQPKADGCFSEQLHLKFFLAK